MKIAEESSMLVDASTVKHRKLRILLSPSAYYPNVGGVEEICRNLAFQLRDKHEVAVAVNRYPADAPQFERLHELDVHRFRFVYPSRELSSLIQIVPAIKALSDYERLIRAWSPDVVHVICPSVNSLYTWLERFRHPFKLLVTLQGELFMDAHEIYKKSRFARFGLQRLLNVADGVTACSNYVMQDALGRFAIKTKMQKVVFNGVDLSEHINVQQNSNLPKDYILGVGRLVHNKGFDVLIRAFALLPNQFSHVKLVLAGDGPEYANLDLLTKSLNAENRVVFTGRLDREQLRPVFQQAKFFVLPSPLEPFGIVVLEAMRESKAVIATNAGGPPEFVGSHHGLLVRPSDAEDLSTKMCTLLSDQRLCEELGKAAGLHVRQFDWSIIGREYAEIYRQICS